MQSWQEWSLVLVLLTATRNWDLIKSTSSEETRWVEFKSLNKTFKRGFIPNIKSGGHLEICTIIVQFNSVTNTNLHVTLEEHYNNDMNIGMLEISYCQALQYNLWQNTETDPNWPSCIEGF
jgi:hypothetical protein